MKTQKGKQQENGIDVDIQKMMSGLASKEELADALNKIEAKLDANRAMTEDEISLMEFLYNKEQEKSNQNQQKTPQLPADLDSISRKELIKLVEEQTTAKLEAKYSKEFEALHRKISDVQTQNITTDLKAEVRRLAKENGKNFNEVSADVFKYYEEHPTLNIDQCFDLATAPKARTKLKEIETSKQNKDPLAGMPKLAGGILPKTLMKGVKIDGKLEETISDIYDRMGGIKDPGEDNNDLFSDDLDDGDDL